MLNNLIRWGIRGLLVILAVGIGIVCCNLWVEYATKAQVFDDLNTIPPNEVGLVLGTSRYTVRGYQNPYFVNRIKAAVDLFNAGKIKHILVSGDNSLKEYNEPKQMRKALIAAGIPNSSITMDFAGFRTLDSVVRSKEVFGQQKLTIISQKFHNHRALYIGNQRGVEAVAFNAADIPFSLGVKTQIRECFARCKAILDMHFLNKQPKFLGEREYIRVAS